MSYGPKGTVRLRCQGMRGTPFRPPPQGAGRFDDGIEERDAHSTVVMNNEAVAALVADGKPECRMHRDNACRFQGCGEPCSFDYCFGHDAGTRAKILRHQKTNKARLDRPWWPRKADY